MAPDPKAISLLAGQGTFPPKLPENIEKSKLYAVFTPGH
jgi:hypothetical protein